MRMQRIITQGNKVKIKEVKKLHLKHCMNAIHHEWIMVA